jgi:hypothetical protein
MGAKIKWSSGKLVYYSGDDSAIGGHALQLGLTATAALLLGGTSTTKLTNSGADKNFIGFWLDSSATSGTSRGLYQRLYLSGGAGGEAIRAYTTVSSNTPADTCNGIHSSLSFGSSAGNITGLGTALRATLHVPGRSLGGTVAALQAEFYGDGASAAIGGVASFLRCVLDGATAAMADSFDDNGHLIELSGATAEAAHLWRTGLTAATINAATTCALRIKVGGTAYYIPVATAATG